MLGGGDLRGILQNNNCTLLMCINFDISVCYPKYVIQQEGSHLPQNHILGIFYSKQILLDCLLEDIFSLAQAFCCRSGQTITRCPPPTPPPFPIPPPVMHRPDTIMRKGEESNSSSPLNKGTWHQESRSQMLCFESFLEAYFDLFLS